MKTLYAGYWTGELGWELMAWQAKLRYLSKSFDDIVVGCHTAMAPIYEDFATDFDFDYLFSRKDKNMWMSKGKTYPLIKSNGVCIEPSKAFCLGDNYESEFIKYGSYNIENDFDILIHARSTDNMNTGCRNYPVESWEKIVDFFGDKRVACIGSESGSKYINGTVNLRNLELRQLFNIMASSKVLLSPSSGPAHLASLCGLPHIVWSDTKRWGIGKYTNKDRYEKIWNPLNTKCTFIPSEDWKPDYRKAIFECQKTLSQY